MSAIKNNELGYLGNPNVKRDGVETSFTKDEILEYQKCMEDPSYFAEKYVKIISLDEGLIPFQLYDYQRNMFEQFKENRFNIGITIKENFRDRKYNI